MNETARIESLSDCIFSFAATLLVIELKAPPANMPFWQGIATLWPGYVSFVLSFFFIGIMWINHHRLFVHIQKADDLLMAVNLVVLLGVVFVPYPTMLMAASITSGVESYARNVAIFYNATYLGIALLFNLLWFVCRQRKVLDHQMGVEYARETTFRNTMGLVCYGACLAMTWFSVPVSLAMNAGIAIYFLLPSRQEREARSGRKSGS
jgi:uncharacterized membrane protein